MNQEERLVRIINYLESNKTMSIKTMCELFEISRDTARRDIVKLSQNKSVVRSYGGISLATFQKKYENYQNRSQEDIAHKKSIGTAAAKMILEHEMIYLDVSTTVNFIAQSIDSKPVTIVTNSIDTAYVSAQSNDAIVHLLGGTLNKSSRHLSGYSTIEKLKDFHFNKVFLSAAGVTDKGLYYLFEEDIHFKRELIKHADQVILLVDQSKFGQQQKYYALALDAIDTLITNDEPPAELQKALITNGVQIIISGET